MNPALDPRIVSQALAEDEAAARAEYGAEWRSDVEVFVKLEVVRACVGDYMERSAVDGVKYLGFTDPSGGSTNSWTLSVAHREGNLHVVDKVVAFKPTAED
jgi:hypothetical protein